MSETLGEHKAPFQKIDNQFEVSDPDWEPGKPAQKLLKNKPKNPRQYSHLIERSGMGRKRLKYERSAACTGYLKDKLIIVLFSALRNLVHDAGLFGLEVSDLANLNKTATQQKVS